MSTQNQQTYNEQTWKFQVKEWRGGRLRITTNGCMDDEDAAVRMALKANLPTQAYKVHTDEVIYKNY